MVSSSMMVGDMMARSGESVITTQPRGVFRGRNGAWVLKVLSISFSICAEKGFGQAWNHLGRLFPMGLRRS